MNWYVLWWKISQDEEININGHAGCDLTCFSTCTVMPNVAVILGKMDRKGLFNEVKFKQRLKWGERMSHKHF